MWCLFWRLLDPDLCIPLHTFARCVWAGISGDYSSGGQHACVVASVAIPRVHLSPPCPPWHQVPERRWRPHYSHPAQACPNEANRVSTWVCQRMQYIILYNLLAISKTPIEILIFHINAWAACVLQVSSCSKREAGTFEVPTINWQQHEHGHSMSEFNVERAGEITLAATWELVQNLKLGPLARCHWQWCQLSAQSSCAKRFWFRKTIQLFKRLQRITLWCRGATRSSLQIYSHTHTALVVAHVTMIYNDDQWRK